MSRQRWIRVVFLGTFLLAALAACQKQPADRSTATANLADSAEKVKLADGQRAYLANCAMCHGAWGLGDGPVAAQLWKDAHVTVARLNRRSRLDSLGRAQVVRVIERGGAHTGRSNLMPSWSERLAPDDIDRIAEFVMALPDLHREVPPAILANYLAAPPGASEEGRRLFVTMCSACHGPYGKGDGRFADTLWARNKIRPRDLTDSLYFASRTDKDLFAIVSLGGGFFHKSPFMPVWNVTLSPQQINDLVAYIRSISRTTPRS